MMFTTALFLYAQDADDEDEDEDEGGINIETDWSRIMNVYNNGDQLFCINLGIVKPLFFVEQNEGYFETQMNLGGGGSLSYMYFLDSHWFLGAELGGMFCSTIGKNMYYIIPVGFRGGYQFIAKRFEFPLSLMIGFAPQSHAERTYFGLFSKSSAGAFFRINTDWSFGINTSFWWVPQWTSKKRELDYRTRSINIHGFFWELTAGVRYHF